VRSRGASYAKRFLRRATRSEHAAAEQTAVMRALFDAKLGSAAYIRLLQGYHALYARWEHHHAAWLRGDLKNAGWQYQTRLRAIESDLDELGVQPTQPLVSANELTLIQPALAIDPASWGSLYVVEGSILGGQIIARKLAVEFPNHPHLFFRLGHGKSRASWKDFQAVMAVQLGDATSRRAIALQARAAFGVFQRMLDGVLR
jgi:heme oxygenase